MNTGFELIPTFVVESSCTISQYKCQYEISSNSDILDLCSSQYFDSTTGEIDGQSLTDAYALYPITYPFTFRMNIRTETSDPNADLIAPSICYYQWTFDPCTEANMSSL